MRQSDENARHGRPVGLVTCRPNVRFRPCALAEHKAKLSALDRQVAQKEAEVETIGATVAKIKALLPIVQQRSDIRETLFGKELGSKLTYLETYQSLVEMQSELSVQVSRQNETAAALNATIEARNQADADWRRGLYADLVEAERKVAGLAQDVAKAAQRSRLQVLTAPVDGVVQQLAVHTIGGVVSPAQALLAVVPAGDNIEVEAQVSNRDVGFIEAGQGAEIKIDTFNYTRYGLVHGQVVSVSRDAITRDRGSDRSTSNAGSEATSSEPKNQDLVYVARVALSQRSMLVEDRTVPLIAGMAVTVEIKTGTRTVLSYLLSPLQRYRSESLRER